MSMFCSSAVINCEEPEPLLNGGVTFLSGFQNQYLSVIQYHCNEPFYALLGGINGEILTFDVLRLSSIINHGEIILVDWPCTVLLHGNAV